MLLSLLGGAAGLIIARFAVGAFEAAVANVGKPSWILFEMDYLVFIYFAAACLVSALLFGLLPGLQASRVDLNATLKEGSRDSGSKRGGLLSGALVVFQFMLAVVLLAGAGLFVRGLLEQRASLAGLPASEVLSAVIQLPEDRYAGRRVPLPVLRPAADQPRRNARPAAGRDHFRSARHRWRQRQRINWKASRKPNPALSPPLGAWPFRPATWGCSMCRSWREGISTVAMASTAKIRSS